MNKSLHFIILLYLYKKLSYLSEIHMAECIILLQSGHVCLPPPWADIMLYL